MYLTRKQIRKIVDQEIDKALNENMDRRQFCKVAAGTAAFFSAGCQEYEIGHLADDNAENMQLPECVQNCYFDDFDNPDAWPKQVDQFAKQFEGKKYIDTFESSDVSTVGFNTYSGISGFVVMFHNVPEESPSLEEVLQLNDEEIETYYTRFDDSEAILSTVEICFLMKDNMLYLNQYQPGGPHNPNGQSDERFRKARPNILISQDHYNRRADLRQCRDAYKAYLYGPIRPEKQETP